MNQLTNYLFLNATNPRTLLIVHPRGFHNLKRHLMLPKPNLPSFCHLVLTVNLILKYLTPSFFLLKMHALHVGNLLNNLQQNLTLISNASETVFDSSYCDTKSARIKITKCSYHIYIYIYIYTPC